MKNTIKPYIIGAGGVASYLLPVLVKSFQCPELWLRDGDTLEERNLDRQLFAPEQIGDNKADALLNNVMNQGSHTGSTLDWRAITSYFPEGESLPRETTVCICVADNHTARRAALFAAQQNNIPLILGGNEYYDSQAMWVDPKFFSSRFDPMVRYPEIETDTSMNPINCTGAVLESSPQLAIANLRCASHIMDLLWLHLVTKTQLPNNANRNKMEAHFPLEIFTSINNNTYIRYDDPQEDSKRN